MNDFSVVGKKYTKPDGIDMLTGRAIYIDDLRLPRMLHAKTLRAAYAHARIVNIDTSRAKKLIGVKAVATADDTPHLRFGAVHPYNIVLDYPLFAEDKVRFFGDAVAAVAAEDVDTAEEALSLIKVEYEPLPVINTPEEALLPGAPVIHDIKPDNIADHNKVYAGDVEKGFAESDIIVEGVYKTTPQEHVSIEPHGAVVSADLAGNITCWTSTQTIWGTRHDLKKLTGIPFGKINVIPTKCGGAFGGKNEVTVEAQLVILAQMTGRPVKMIYTREEEFTASTIRHPMTSYSKIGVKKDGTIMAKQARILVENGAYTGLGQGILYYMGSISASLYKVPNVKVDSYLVYTNNVWGGAMRGYGNPQSHFNIEIEMDRVAEALNMDPIEFRLKNLPKVGERSSCGIINPSGLHECLMKATSAVDWKNKWKGWVK